MIFKKTLLAAAALAFSGYAMTAAAAVGTSTNPTFQVSITITSACTFAAGASSNIAFGNIPSNTALGSSSLKGTSNISVTCSNKTPYIVGLTTSAGTAGTGTMKSATPLTNADQVPYSLFKDSGYTNAWGSTGTAPGTPGNNFAGTGNGSAQSIPVYAQVTNPNFTPDTYSDTVTVNVIF